MKKDMWATRSFNSRLPENDKGSTRLLLDRGGCEDGCFRGPS